MKFNELVIRLEQIGVDNARSEAQLILEHLFGVRPSDILLKRENEYDSDQIGQILKKREEKIPLQYIFGKWYFMDSTFFVSPDCLIPRQDTEILVYEAIKLLKSGGSVADLCTGSGCIGISIAKQRQDISALVLADISEKALDMARKNANAIIPEKNTIFAPCDVTKKLPEGKFDMITSNPPYIPKGDIEGLSDEVKKEPRLALDGGEDGLDIVRALVDNVPASLNENGYFLMEFGYDQREQISSLMDEKVKEGKYKLYKILDDYGANPRVLVAQI